MDPESKLVHTIKLRIDELGENDNILIGLVPNDAFIVRKAMIFCNEAYSYAKTGSLYQKSTLLKKGNAKYEKGDIVSLELNFNELSLRYEVHKDSKQSKSGVLLRAGEVQPLKYRWAFGLYEEKVSISVLALS